MNKTDITPIIASMLSLHAGYAGNNTYTWLGALRHAPDYRVAGKAYLARTYNASTLREIADDLRRTIDFEWSLSTLEDALREHGEGECYIKLQIYNSDRTMYLLVEDSGQPATSTIYPRLNELITDNRSDVENFLDDADVDLYEFAGCRESGRYVEHLRDLIVDELDATGKWHTLDVKPEQALANRWYIVDTLTDDAVDCGGVYILPAKE